MKYRFLRFIIIPLCFLLANNKVLAQGNETPRQELPRTSIIAFTGYNAMQAGWEYRLQREYGALYSTSEDYLFGVRLRGRFEFLHYDMSWTPTIGINFNSRLSNRYGVGISGSYDEMRLNIWHPASGNTHSNTIKHYQVLFEWNTYFLTTKLKAGNEFYLTVGLGASIKNEFISSNVVFNNPPKLLDELPDFHLLGYKLGLNYKHFFTRNIALYGYAGLGRVITQVGIAYSFGYDTK